MRVPTCFPGAEASRSLDAELGSIRRAEYQMLEALVLRKGITLSKDVLLHQLYGGTDAPEMKIIDVFVCKLCKKLAQATNGDSYIRTLWGQGYQFFDPTPQNLAA